MPVLKNLSQSMRDPKVLNRVVALRLSRYAHALVGFLVMGMLAGGALGLLFALTVLMAMIIFTDRRLGVRQMPKSVALASTFMSMLYLAAGLIFSVKFNPQLKTLPTEIAWVLLIGILVWFARLTKKP